MTYSLSLLSTVLLATGLQVNIDYSFYLPEELGKGTVETVDCCPYGVLPEKNNNTQSLMAPTVLGIGTQKSGEKRDAGCSGVRTWRSGTTTLFEHLKQHPQLLGSMKELYYFSNAGNETYEHYLKYWKINTDGKESIKDDEGNVLEIKALFEVTPEYIYVSGNSAFLLKRTVVECRGGDCCRFPLQLAKSRPPFPTQNS